MAASSSVSMMLSATLAVLLFAAMQMYRTPLGESKAMTILGGFLGHILFILILTAVGNFENLMFGPNFKTQLFPEVLGCLALAMFASGLVHRVCVTTCFIFSLVALYFINKISNSMYTPSVQSAATPAKSRAKKRN